MRQSESHHPSGARQLPGGATMTPVENGWLVDIQDRARAAEALRAAVAAAQDLGPGRLQVWARGVEGAPVASAATGVGMVPRREVLQMRRPLPVERSWSLSTRSFVVGEDEQAWLEVNNRAFAWHPDQADMTLEQVQAKEQEPWFDPEGFLLHEEEDQLLGFCWTKVHADAEPPLGEIYVIAVDPSAHGRGLGRQLVLAGLDHLHQRGITVGMLYVEADNDPAISLYRDLGFEVHTSDRRYDLEVSAR